MLKIVGNETAHDGMDGRSLLDEIARGGARRMLMAAWRPRSLRTWRRTARNATTRGTPWSSATARGAPNRTKAKAA